MITKLEKAAAISLLMQFLDSRIRISPKVVLNLDEGLCRGNGVKAKGGLGSLIVIAEECDTNYGIKEWKAAVVDGDEIKPDVWYKLENGEFVETSEEED